MSCNSHFVDVIAPFVSTVLLIRPYSRILVPDPVEYRTWWRFAFIWRERERGLQNSPFVFKGKLHSLLCFKGEILRLSPNRQSKRKFLESKRPPPAVHRRHLAATTHGLTPRVTSHHPPAGRPSSLARAHGVRLLTHLPKSPASLRRALKLACSTSSRKLDTSE